MEKMKDEYTSAEHYLLALADSSVPAGRYLKQAGVTRDRLLQAVQQVRGSQRVTDPNPEGKYQSLEKYGRDLTALARRGKIDPVIGRDNEIRRVMQVLSRRTKNNPVLIGDPGVGGIETAALLLVLGDRQRQRPLAALDGRRSILGSHLGAQTPVSGTHLISLPHGEAGPLRRFVPNSRAEPEEDEVDGPAEAS